MAQGQEGEAEDRDAVEAPAGPVHPGTEVPQHRLGKRASDAEQSAQARRRGRARHHGGQADHHAAHVEEEHDVEGRAVAAGACTPDIFIQLRADEVTAA